MILPNELNWSFNSGGGIAVELLAMFVDLAAMASIMVEVTVALPYPDLIAVFSIYIQIYI